MTTPRSNYLAQMDALDQKGVNCNACKGYCCTFAHNSMRITKEEADAILPHLTTSDWERIDSCIERFQLERPLTGDGQRSFLRRYYTCPFFDEDATRCMLLKTMKPYGCLAFNPTLPNETEGRGCKLTLKMPEHLQGQETLPIPVALKQWRLPDG